MEDQPLSSPERGPLRCKVTYLERKKRKRNVSNQADSDSDTSFKSKSTASPMKKNTNSPKKSDSKAPASRGPKKVDVSLPGPSPKRARRDSDESIKVPKVKKATHVRAASSLSSLKQVAEKVADSPSSATKPESVSAPIRKPKSKAKSIATEEDFDDSVSVVDSVVSTKVRRNEAERIQYFQNQPECGKMEAHQVHCIRCNKPVNLGRKQTYTVRPWEIHRVRCDQKPAQTIPATPDAPEDPQTVEEPESPLPAVASASKPTQARRPSEEDRKDLLNSDKQIEKVEKHRVCCRKCQNWIDLSETLPYATRNWVKHKSQCSDAAVPSKRVAAARRKLDVVNDPQVKTFDARKIKCAFCSVIVKLDGEGEFNLTSWHEHKSSCTKSVPLSKSESMNSVLFPTRFSGPPSSASTEDTLVVDAGPSRSSQALKRSRDEPDVIAEEDQRPSVRPRSASYLPPKQEAPSTVLGWFMLPFHSFVRGFKESLHDKS